MSGPWPLISVSLSALTLTLMRVKPSGSWIEVVLDAEVVELALDLFAREAYREAEGRAFMAEVAEDDGDVDALAAAEDLLVVHAVDLASREGIEADDVVERGVESYGVDHSSLLSFQDCRAIPILLVS